MKLDFEKMGGLVPAIIQDAETGKVLMLAYMNQIAWDKTLETGKAWFYSRSRDKQWMKGEESGKRPGGSKKSSLTAMMIRFF